MWRGGGRRSLGGGWSGLAEEEGGREEKREGEGKERSGFGKEDFPFEGRDGTKRNEARLEGKEGDRSVELSLPFPSLPSLPFLQLTCVKILVFPPPEGPTRITVLSSDSPFLLGLQLSQIPVQTHQPCQRQLVHLLPFRLGLGFGFGLTG